MAILSNRPGDMPKKSKIIVPRSPPPLTQEEVYAPPKDSEDESEPETPASKPPSNLDSSDGSSPMRGASMIKSDFSRRKPTAPGCSQRSAAGKGKTIGDQSKAERASISQRRPKRSQDEDHVCASSPAHPAKRRRSSPIPDEDDDDFLANIKRSDKNKTGYSKKKTALSKDPSVVKSGKTNTAAPTAASASSVRPRIKVPSSLGPRPGKERRTTTIKRPRSLPPSPAAEEPKALKVPLDAVLGSPSRSRARKKRARPTARADEDAPGVEIRSAAVAMFKIPGLIPGATSAGAATGSEPTDMATPSAASSVSDSKDEVLGSQTLTVPDVEEATCPFCYQTVDAQFLSTFARGKPLSMRQQMRFCDAHKKDTARKVWKERGYPSIDWEQLDSRLERHQRPIRRILDGGPSHFKSILADKQAAGKERTLKKTDRSLAPGYYGNRGLRLMSEHIIRYFNETLRKKAVDDAVIAGRGTTFFVSTVLVPEMATRLIMEDMAVGIEQARLILAESVDVGDLLHEDVGDSVEEVVQDS